MTDAATREPVVASNSWLGALDQAHPAWPYRWRLPLIHAAVVLMAAAAPAAAQIPVERLELLVRAQVWRPTDIAAMNLRVGPPGPGAFAPNETVPCEYVAQDLAGRSPKFRCRLASGDDVKVKFGVGNGEVYGEVAATRLLWALGFGADRMYPVRIVCRGCPTTIGDEGKPGERIVDPAAIERRTWSELPAPGDGGWSWAELDLIDERDGGAPRAERDALKLLAVFLQHTDTKPEQQRLVCLDPGFEPGGPCVHPLMMLNDVGLTFGRATLLNSNAVSGMNYRAWAGSHVWKYSTSCIGNLPRSLTGTLRDPLISEEGRQFLARLLLQLSDAQLRDLFAVARAERRNADPETGTDVAAAQWVDTFKQKRAEIVNRHCTDDWSSQAPYLFTTAPNLWLQGRASPGLTAAMIAVSLCGYLPFYAALTMLLAFSVNVRAGASLIVLLVLTGALTDAAKIVVSYPRPDVVDPRVQALAPMRLITASAGNVALGDHLPAPVRAIVNGVAAHAPTMSSEDAYGFPSGHVANAVAFVCGLVFLFRWQAAWMAAALWIPLMALSRMYLGRHFFADVIGGLAAGLVATMIVVRALNLQRLHDQGQRRVLIKTVALAVLCALLAIGGAIPPVYESGRLLGAAVALVVVSRAAPIEYDHAPAAVKAARLGAATLIFALTWWVTSGWLVPITARTSLATLVIGALPIAALIPAPVLLERVLRR